MKRISTLFSIAILLTACGDSSITNPPDSQRLEPARIVAYAGDQQLGTAAMPLPEPVVVRVVDSSGRGVPGVPVVFTVYGGWISPNGATLTDGQGLVSVTWYMGPRASDNGLAASSPVGIVAFRSYALPLTPGIRYLGADGLTELRMGDLPLILSAPNGGTEAPAGIGDRMVGDTTSAPDTDLLVQAIDDAFATRGEGRPTLVISHLVRRKADMDHALEGSTAGYVEAERAWREYHGFLAAARAFLQDREVRGLIVDVHGRNAVDAVELGYLLTAADLSVSDLELNGSPLPLKSSIRDLRRGTVPPFSAIVRGPSSLGGLLDGHGVPVIPSPSVPRPTGDGYLPGGYIVDTYGSRDGSLVSALSLQVPRELRDTGPARAEFAGRLRDALDQFFHMAYGRALLGGQ